MVWKISNNIQNIQKKYSDKQLSNIYFLARTNYLFCAGFFHTRKNLKNFSKEVIKSHLAVLIWVNAP